MSRLIAAAAVLLLGTTALADMGMPGDRHVPVRITLNLDTPPPGVFLFIQDNRPLRRMAATSNIVIESTPERGGAGFTIYAVPEGVVASWPDGTMPHRDWFGRHDNPDCKTVGAGGAKGRVAFNDSRSAIEQAYRLIRTGDEMRLMKTFENESNPVYSNVVGYGTCCGIPVGIAALGLWLVGKLFRRGK
ncbi:MAG: hypothetical protein U0804_20900 [Gemmataceae bacterium]